MEKMDRSKFMGGSDAAGVLGLSRWKTPLSVWAEKTGQYIPEDIDNEAKELGRELEDYVAKRFARKTGKNVLPPLGYIQHPSFDFIGGNIDRIIQDEDAILECKTASAWKVKEWQGQEIPQEYIIQCYHYMMVTGKKKAYIACLIGNQSFVIKELFWDDRVMADMLKREVSFWNDFVIPKVMPTSITYRDSDTLEGLFPVATEGKEIHLQDDANIIVENLIANKQDLVNLEHQIERSENELKALLKDAERGSTSLYSIGWTNSKRSSLDGKSLKETFPDIHAQFYKSKPTRLFKYKPIKGE